MKLARRVQLREDVERETHEIVAEDAALAGKMCDAQPLERNAEGGDGGGPRAAERAQEGHGARAGGGHGARGG